MMSQQGPSEEESPLYTQDPPQEPVKVLQGRLAKGEITPEQYQASLNVLQGSLSKFLLPFIFHFPFIVSGQSRTNENALTGQNH
jgi:hypothetical protein